MGKKEVGRGKILVVAVAILALLVIFHTYYSISGISAVTSKGISGKQVLNGDSNGEAADEEEGDKALSTKTRIIIASEWILVILAMLYTLIKAKNKFKKEEKEAESSIKNVSLKKGRNKTDIDLLYELLLLKKSLQISAIAKYFKVSKPVAMDWCQILEEGNLAEIHYPTVGDPKIELNEIKEANNSENEAKQKA